MRFPSKRYETDPMKEWGVKNMLALKAAVYANGNESQLLRQALKVYRAPIAMIRDLACPHCHTPTDETLDEFVADGNVVFVDVPTIVCATCGRKSWRLSIAAELERLAEHIEYGERFSLQQALEMEENLL